MDKDVKEDASSKSNETNVDKSHSQDTSKEDGKEKKHDKSSEDNENNKTILQNKQSGSESKDKTSSHIVANVKDSSEVEINEEDVIHQLVEIMETVVDDENNQYEYTGIWPCSSCEFPDPIEASTTECCFGLFQRYYENRNSIDEFWIVSATGDTTPQETFEKLSQATANGKLSVNYKFHIPKLKISSIDNMFGIVDELKVLDKEIEQILDRLVDFMKEIVEEKSKFVDLFKVNNVDLPTYITQFSWNKAKYSVKNSLSDILVEIQSQTKTLQNNMKNRMNEYRDIESRLRQIERQINGNLMTKPLGKIVKKDDFILGSKMLATLLVVVPKNMENDWNDSYESLIDYVIPRSSEKLINDESQILFTVAVHKKFIDEFKQKAKEKNFMVRDFEYNEEFLNGEAELEERLKRMAEKQRAVSCRWTKVNFSECFATWMHIKAMSVWIESVLRFGLEVSFQPVVLIPLKPEKLKETLDKLFRSEENVLSAGHIDDVPGNLQKFEVEEYTPYIFMPLKLSMLKTE